MPAKFLVGSRRPRSLRSLSRAHISSQNVTSANNYGIVKAGDGGNGGRGADGVGGADATALIQDNKLVSISNGINGKDGGHGQEAGKVYITQGTLCNENNFIPSSKGTDGAGGNNGWAGVDLYAYTFKSDELDWGFNNSPYKGDIYETQLWEYYINLFQNGEIDMFQAWAGISAPFVRSQFISREDAGTTTSFYVQYWAGKKSKNNKETGFHLDTKAHLMIISSRFDDNPNNFQAKNETGIMYPTDDNGKYQKYGYAYRINCDRFQYQNTQYHIKNLKVEIYSIPGEGYELVGADCRGIEIKKATA